MQPIIPPILFLLHWGQKKGMHYISTSTIYCYKHQASFLMQTILWRETVLDRQRENYLYNLKKFCLLFVVLFFFLNLPMRLKNKNLLPHMAFRPILLAFTVIPPISNTRNVQSTLSSTNYFATSIQKKKNRRWTTAPWDVRPAPQHPRSCLSSIKAAVEPLGSSARATTRPYHSLVHRANPAPRGLSHRSRHWRPWSSLQQANSSLLR
jgi:hypothetical protein